MTSIWTSATSLRQKGEGSRQLQPLTFLLCHVCEMQMSVQVRVVSVRVCVLQHKWMLEEAAFKMPLRLEDWNAQLVGSSLQLFWCRMRIFQYYLPVFFWCWNQVKTHQSSGAKRPLVIGMQAVQGCGKTTLVEQLQNLFTHVGLTAASISIDDFYLPYRSQQQLIKVPYLPCCIFSFNFIQQWKTNNMQCNEVSPENSSRRESQQILVVVCTCAW